MPRLLPVAVLLVVLPLLPPPSPRVLDARTAAYLEDAEVPRPVASVRAELVEAGGAVRLRVAVAALGDEVAPLPGLEGVHGANLRTAEELERLLREDALRLVLRRSGREVAGEDVVVERARLPARRVGAGGRLELDAATAAEWPVRATFTSPPLPAGESWCYLVADGHPRLAVGARCSTDGVRITTIESRAEPRGPIGGAAVRR